MTLSLEKNFEIVDGDSAEQPLSGALIYKIAYQQANFEVLLENMSQGVGMFDFNQNVVFCNRRFFEIFGITDYRSDEVRTLEDILVLRVRTGCYPKGDARSYAAQCVGMVRAQQSQTVVHELRNGFILMEKHIPFEGGGWLTCFEDITEIYQLKREIEHLAFHDHLTGLPNRHGMVRAIERLKGQGYRDLTLLYLDLDGFKQVNDHHGHLIGDLLLKMVAKRLSECAKKPDCVLRIGGDEFAIISNAQMTPGDAATLAQRIVSCVETPFVIDNLTIEISVSVGVLQGNASGATFDKLLTKADAAMYAAKRAGKGKFRFHQD